MQEVYISIYNYNNSWEWIITNMIRPLSEGPTCIFSIKCVSKMKCILSVIFMQYTGLCIFSLSMYLLMIMRIFIYHLIIIIKSDIGIVSHCLVLSHEPMLCAMCLAMFLEWYNAAQCWHIDFKVSLAITDFFNWFSVTRVSEHGLTWMEMRLHP